MAANSERFVVLHAGVGAWTQGQVIDQSAIEQAGGDVGRLTSLSAIRPATPEESAQERVPVSFGTLAMSPAAQMVLAEKDAEIDRLRRVIGDRQDARAFLERAAAAPELPDHVKAIAAEKDAEIDRLRARLAETEKGREQAQEAAQKQAEAAKSAGPQPPAGATPVLNPENRPLAEEAERLRQEAKKEEAPKPRAAEAPKTPQPAPAATRGPTAETKAAGGADDDFDQPRKKK